MQVGKNSQFARPRRAFALGAIGLVLLLWSWSPLAAFVDYPYGVNFLTVRLPLLPLDESDLDPEEQRWSVRMSTQWINVWSFQRSRFMVDGEEFQITPSLRFAIDRDSQVGFSIPLKSVGGGVMDRYIEDFHTAIGVGQSLRDHYNRNQFNVSYEPLGPYYWILDNNLMTTFLRLFDFRAYPRRPTDPPVVLSAAQRNDLGAPEVIPGSGTTSYGVGDARFFYQRTLWRGRTPYVSRVTGGVQFKSPSNSNELLSSRGLDSSVYVVLAQDAQGVGEWGWRLGVSYSHFQMQQFYFLTLPAHQWVIRPAVDYVLDEEWTLTAEYVYFSKPIRNFGRLSKPAHQFTIAARKQFDGWNMAFGLVENFINYTVAPDIGLHMSFEARR